MSTNMTAPAMTHLLTIIRNKRQLWGSYGYDNYYGYGFHWSRIIFFIFLLIAIFLCCLVPCICALGICFNGWFKLRDHAVQKFRRNSSITANASKQQQPPVSQTITVPQNYTRTGPENCRKCMDSYIYEEERNDRYYQRHVPPHLHDYRQSFTSSRV